MTAIKHLLVYWDEEGLTSIIKASQLVESHNVEAGTKARIKWGRKVLPATVIDLGSKAKLKERQVEYHKKLISDRMYPNTTQKVPNFTSLVSYWP